MITKKKNLNPKTIKPLENKAVCDFERIDTWKNRRWMTWCAVIVGIIVYPFSLFLAGGLFPNAGALAESVNISLYSLIGGIVLSYFGGVTAEDIMKHRNKKDDQ